jgi:hypothetical protein
LDDPDFKAFKQNENTKCLFNYKPKVDIPVTALGIAGAFTGSFLLGQKEHSDSAEILALNPETDIIGINRNAIHNYSPEAGHVSDFFLYGGMFYGFLVLADHDVRQDALKVSLLYLETLAITGASYELTAGLIDKYRPYTYNTDSVLVDGAYQDEVPFPNKTNKNSKNSFYGGHCSVPAASAFFVATVYGEYHPHSKFRFVLYGVAAAATSTTAYLRLKGGYHFPTDLAVGMALGSAYGLIIPRLHRCKTETGLSFSPILGKYNGLNLAYKF